MTDQFARHEIAWHEIARQEIAGHENDGQKWRQGAKLQENKKSFNREVTLQWSVQIFKAKTLQYTVHTVSWIPACAQVVKLSPLYFNLRRFSNRSSNRLQRSNAKSTQYIQPQTFAASESVSYAALLCSAVLLFHVLHFHVLSFGPSFSRPAFSAPPLSFRN